MKRRLYFDVTNGEVFFVTNQKFFTTVENDIAKFIPLQNRTRESFDYIDLEENQYKQDFAEASSYRVNPETLELEFSYPDPNDPGEPQPYQPPLSEEVARLKEEDLNNKEAIAELYLMSLGGY